MKDKRLDALLETLPQMVCNYYIRGAIGQYEPKCQMKPVGSGPHDLMRVYPTTDCQGDIRKCEREE